MGASCFKEFNMMSEVKTLEQLAALYQPAPTLAATAKELDHLIPEYRTYIESSPFVALATYGPEGLDCSPRGDEGQCVYILNDKTLALPDRRGNNRIDSLKNILRDPHVALLFLLPGSNTTFRINGTAKISIDEALLKQFTKQNKPPRSVIVVKIEAAYFQCGRAVVRSKLWDPATQSIAAHLPTPGKVLQRTTAGEIQAEPYDSAWSERAKSTLW
jgi:uncharacterized protein